MENQRTFLKITDLTIGYGKQILFEKLNLALHKGDLICFMGPNGIGKSSLIRTIAGLQKPLSGTIDFQDSGPVHHQLAVVLTDRVTALNMTVRELVSFGRYPYLSWNIQLTGADVTIIENALAQVGISHLSEQRIFELSDGQVQLVMIARALAQETPLILLDEPTAHLDLNNRLEIMKLLRGLAHELQKSVLVSTHELDLALQTADGIWLAGRHQNVLQGIPEDLVLRGDFDEIFQFKGFDLKTGKVQHEVSRSETIQIIGQGHEILWTRNALERSGFRIVEGAATCSVTVTRTNANTITWSIDGAFQTRAIGGLLEYLSSNPGQQTSLTHRLPGLTD